MWIVTYFTNNGIPQTGLTPTITIWKVSDNSILVNADNMSEIGNGWYKYNYTDYDPTVEIVIQCDGGSTLNNQDRYTWATNENYYNDIQSSVWDATASEFIVTGSMGELQNLIDNIPFNVWNYSTRTLTSFDILLLDSINSYLSNYHGWGIWEDKDSPINGEFIINQDEITVYKNSIGVKFFDSRPSKVELHNVSENSIQFIQKLDIKELIQEEKWYVTHHFDQTGLYIIISSLENSKEINYVKVIESM